MGTNQLINGLILTGLGMGVVFLFLVILIFTTKLMSWVVGKSERKANSALPETSAPRAGGDEEVAIAIAAAVRESRRI